MTRLPFSSFQSFSCLFRDYTENSASLASFFNGDYRSDEDLIASCKTAASNHPERDVLIRVLRRQAASFGVEESSRALISKLSDPTASAVVTGQQLGLFGGPLYTLYKFISAIQLAEKMESLSGTPVVPVFWLEGEDHDFEEIAYAGFLNGDDPTKVTYEPADAHSTTAIGRRVLTEDITRTLDELENLLPPTDFRNDLMARLREAYAPGRSMLQAFVQVVDEFIGPGHIVYISPDDEELKDSVSSLFEKELTDYAASSAALAEASARLEGSWHAQVKTSPTNLFLHSESGRSAIDAENNAFRTRDGHAFTNDAMIDLLRADPGAFSPNVVMRPLMQDSTLPTAAYVAGPGEVAYFAQFKGLYEWAGLHMPIIYPRASLTLMERRIDKVLQKNELPLTAFEEQIDKLFNDVVKQRMDGDLEADFKAASAHLHQAINDIKPVIERVDRSLVKSTEATRAALMKEWGQLQGRVFKAEKQQHDTLREQLERASSSLFPSGIPQERFLSPVYFANKYGPDFTRTLMDRMDLDSSEHQILDI